MLTAEIKVNGKTIAGIDAQNMGPAPGSGDGSPGDFPGDRSQPCVYNVLVATVKTDHAPHQTRNLSITHDRRFGWEGLLHQITEKIMPTVIETISADQEIPAGPRMVSAAEAKLLDQAIEALAILRAPGLDNDGGASDIAEEVRVLLHNMNVFAQEMLIGRTALEKITRYWLLDVTPHSIAAAAIVEMDMKEPTLLQARTIRHMRLAGLRGARAGRIARKLMQKGGGTLQQA